MHHFIGIPTKSCNPGFWIIIALWVVISCNKSSNSGEEINDGTTYYLQKVDSIHIDRDNAVRLLDFHPSKNHFLAYELITEEFLIVDENGRILEASYLVGEGPNEYNSSLLAASFNQEGGGYFLQSSNEFLWYNPDWELEERVRFASSIFIRFYSGPRLEVPYFRYENDSFPHFFTNFFSGVNNGVRGIDEGNESDYLIEFYNPGRESLEWGLANEKELLPGLMEAAGPEPTKPTQVFALDRKTNQLFLTFERSTEIGIYDIAWNFELEERLTFKHNDFSVMKNSRNKSVFQFDDDLLGILYFEGLSEAATESRKTEDPEYFPFRDTELYHLIILQDGVQLEKEIAFPEGCEPLAEILALPGRRLLMRDRYRGEDEPTYSTYSIFELKSDI
ncbi:hypothetical protein [Cyclobacterium sp.]|uniref:hypothetical protein n=1 Tax=Cyclobacterium sp. TaxID=1966343 RepID=UPI0019A91ABC|nr:hypothetical protein [Cyclobacterium sp.]MBD3630468.1 hypothetical protein [Cyclobacterium sp.]